MIKKGMIGKKVLVTADNWFYGPDGKTYRGVYGTLIGIMSDSDALGISTNRHSTNWYAQIGNVMIAGCQIHYCVLTDTFDSAPPKYTSEHDGEQKVHNNLDSAIFVTE